MQKKDEWSAAFFCFLVFFFFAGMQKSSSVFFVEVLTLFNINREVASIPFTIQLSIVCILGPLAGYLATRYEPTAVTLVGCFLGALGIGFSFVAQNIATMAVFWGLYGIGHGLAGPLVPPILNNFFNKYFSTACGIAFCGMGVGGMVFPILSNTLIQTYSVSGASLIIGGLTLNLVPFMYLLHCNACITKKSKQHSSREQQPISVISVGQESDFLKDKSVLVEPNNVEADQTANIKINPNSFKAETRNVQQHQDIRKIANDFVWNPFLVFFDLTFLAILLVQGSLTVVICFFNTILVDLFLEKSVTAETAVYMVMGISIGDIIGRLVIGRISDIGLFTIVTLAILCQILMTVCYLSLVWCRGVIACSIPSVGHGIFAGGLWVLILPIMRNYIEKQKITLAMSSKNILSLPIIFAIPSIIGFFKDRMGSYDGLLFTFAGACLICSIVTYIIPYLAQRRDGRKLSL